MKQIRIIPRIDVKGHNLVKGVHLEGLRVLGLPERFSEHYFNDGADELIYIDIVASLYGRNNLEEIVKRTAENVFIPITVGGGIRSVNDIRRLLRAGADKVAINTEAIKNPQLIKEGARVFGSQCIVVSIQSVKVANGKYEAYTDNGREPTGKDVFDWAKQASDLGCGEILITSVDREGTGEGYDIELISKLIETIHVPVVACGGAGKKEHVSTLINECKVDAVSAGSIFHYYVLHQYGVEKRKEGNTEYLKRFVESNGEILKRLEPITVSILKQYLRKCEINCISNKSSDESEKNKKSLKEFSIKSKKENSSKVIIVDYGRGNLFSVKNAFEKIGANVEISSNPSEILNASKIILAGVGAFHDGMTSIIEMGLLAPLRDFAASGKPVLGICLGLQLLMSKGEEFGTCDGIHLISGKVVRLKDDDENGDKTKIPHIGWSRIEYSKKNETCSTRENTKKWMNSVILKDIPLDSFVYFLHSYVVVPDDSSLIMAETKYGTNTFCSVIKKDNIFGCQFHPEKSGNIGLRIYRNFIYN